MLKIEDLVTGYGETIIIHHLNLEVKQGSIFGILGRNGVGKSTSLKAIMGLLHVQNGHITFDDSDITNLPPYVIAKKGIAYIPETRDIFSSLTVRENLMLGMRIHSHSKHQNGKAENTESDKNHWHLDRVLEVFPKLAERLNNGGNQLSGGEQQMLAIARALLMNPKLLILDEPTEGLAPIIVKQIHNILSTLKKEGMTMILVEQNFRFAVSLADSAIVLGHGKSVWSGSAEQIKKNTKIQSEWLGVY